MQGDFSRNSFDPLQHYSRVLQQQGRVELDADTNERQAILLHLVRNLAADLIGPHGGPGAGGGFLLTNTDGSNNFAISRGHYYIDGWLCENDAEVSFNGTGTLPPQPWLPSPQPKLKPTSHLVYLDVWERHVSALQADDPRHPRAPTALREVALNGPDTCSRAQVVWQVKTRELDPKIDIKDTDGLKKAWQQYWAASLSNARPRGYLQVKAAQTLPAEGSKPCVVSPQSGYRGLENQLYRVEVHRGGTLATDKPTFVWSRENGSVELPVDHHTADYIQLANGWRDARLGLAVGDVLEYCEEATLLSGQPGPLLRVTAIDLDQSQLRYEASGALSVQAPGTGQTAAPIKRLQTVLRRWDHGLHQVNGNGHPELADDLALRIEEGKPLLLEDGITIQFNKGSQDNLYATGDYWLIPARTALGNVLWPEVSDPGVPPHGVAHHCAPLGAMAVDANGKVTLGSTLSNRFKSLVELSSS